MTVQELWDRTWGTIQTLEKANLDFITAVNEATEHIFQYLWKRKSDLSTDLMAISYFEPIEDASLDGTDSPLLAVRTLDANFRGLAERPFVDGESNALQPMTEDIRIAITNQTSGKPTHYELRGNKLYLWPLPEDKTVLRLLYFKHPGVVTGYEDTLPFYAVFDMAYRTIVLAVVELGVSTDLTPILDKHVGEIMPVRDYHSSPRSTIQDF